MKKLIAILFLSVTMLIPGVANDGQYVEAMQKSIQLLYAAQNGTEIQNAINSLERIGSAEKTKWEPFYYSSFGYVRMAAKETDGAKKDAYLDLAKSALEKAEALRKDDAEIVAMGGFIMMLRVTVDPATRGPQYAGLVMQVYQHALSINPNNPRALALLAQMQFGTAQFFNQPTTEACANASKAMALFGQNQSQDALAPKWGKEMTQGLLINCQ